LHTSFPPKHKKNNAETRPEVVIVFKSIIGDLLIPDYFYLCGFENTVYKSMFCAGFGTV
jgi:hypothetical protein